MWGAQSVDDMASSVVKMQHQQTIHNNKIYSVGGLSVQMSLMSLKLIISIHFFK
jgi:hypothetical protein